MRPYRGSLFGPINISFLITRASLPVLLISVGACGSRFDMEAEDAAVTFEQMRFVSGSIYQASLDEGIPEQQLVLTQSVAKVAVEKGRSHYPRSTQDKSPLKLNPSQEMWRSPTTNPSEVMMYSPRQFKLRKGTTYYVGILFNGKRTNLSRLPDWKALNLDPAR